MQKRQRSHTGIRVTVLFIFTCIIVFILLQSPVFRIKNITVRGTQEMPRETIVSLSDLQQGISIFGFSTGNTKEKILKSPLIANVNIKRVYPSTVIITVLEKKSIGYIPFEGTYLYIDQDGVVIDSQQKKGQALLLLEGIQIKHFTLGSSLGISKEVLDAIAVINDGIAKYNLDTSSLKLNVKNSSKLTLQKDKITIILGDLTEMDYKIRNIKEALKVLSKGYQGYYDISNPEKPIFKPLL